MSSYPTRLLLIVSVFSKLCSAFLIGAELPCDFHDSINITDGIHHLNGSIFFKGLEFTPDQYTRTNYILTKSMERIRVEHYTRGCICNVRPCYRLCCLHGSFVDDMSSVADGECLKSKANQHLQKNGIDENDHIVYIDHACAYRLAVNNSVFGIFCSLNIFQIVIQIITFQNKMIPHNFHDAFCSVIINNEMNPYLKTGKCMSLKKKLNPRDTILPYGEWYLSLTH